MPTLKVKSSYTFTDGKTFITALSQTFVGLVLCILLISESMMYLDDVKSSKHTLTSLLLIKRLQYLIMHKQNLFMYFIVFV